MELSHQCISVNALSAWILSFCVDRAKLLKANVHFLSPSIVNGTTGTVIVLTTPDAQRTMLSYQVCVCKTELVHVDQIHLS